MKLAILAVCLLAFLLLECQSSPVQLVENHELVTKAKALGSRQAATGDVAPAAPVAAADEDDDDDDDEDDDDDDDDDGGIADLLDDDDDDDDDEEEDTPQGQAAPAAGAAAAASDDDDDDDDDDDYIDRIFDDILGDDDDDDDDDEDDTPAAAVAQPASVPASVQPAVESIPVAQPAAVAEGLEEAASVASEAENAIDPAEGEQNVFYEDENNGIDTKVDISSLNNKPVESTTAKVSSAIAPVATSASSDDDDDDDEEDDITAALTGDDDDEDDDDTDDDDDDDDIGGGLIEARRARGAEKNVIIEMPKNAFQERHNQFIDAIFARINRIVSDSYDPFKVRLPATPKQATKGKPSKASGATKSNKKSKTKKATTNGSKARSSDGISANTSSTDTKSEAIFEQKSTTSSVSLEEVKQKQEQKPQAATNTESAEKRTVPSLAETKNRKKTQPIRSNLKTSVSANNKQTTKQTVKQASSTTPNVASQGAPVVKQRRAEGSLSGLASLRRVGNAKVVTDPEGRNSTIKSKFTLGPLTLKVEKSFKRGNVRNVKTATARTNEMIGRIKFSVVNDQATLVSIKVQQPQQVEVESKDNHDRTREFVWTRTPKIARLVSEKLRLAAESLFQPTAGVEVVRL